MVSYVELNSLSFNMKFRVCFITNNVYCIMEERAVCSSHAIQLVLMHICSANW